MRHQPTFVQKLAIREFIADKIVDARYVDARYVDGWTDGKVAAAMDPAFTASNIGNVRTAIYGPSRVRRTKINVEDRLRMLEERMAVVEHAAGLGA